MGLITKANQNEAYNTVTIDGATGGPPDPQLAGDENWFSQTGPQDSSQSTTTSTPETATPPADAATQSTPTLSGAPNVTDPVSPINTPPLNIQQGGAAAGDSNFDSVGGQLDQMNQGLISLLNNQNPLMQQAAAQGRRSANARGLGSSSFSERAAQGAVFDVALPMVQQASSQAQAYEQLRRQQDFSAAQAHMDRMLAQWQQNSEIDYRRWLQETTLQHEQLIMTNEQANNAYINFVQAATEILNNPETTSDQKGVAMAALHNGLSSQLFLLEGLSGLNLSAFLPAEYDSDDSGDTGGGGWADWYDPNNGQLPPNNPITDPIPNDPQDIQNWLQEAATITGIPINMLGQFNDFGGLTSVNPDIQWGDLMAPVMDGAAAFAQTFFDNAIVDMLSEAFPGLFEDDSLWSNLLGLGINLTATPVNILTNMIGGIYNYFFGDEEPQPGTEPPEQPTDTNVLQGFNEWSVAQGGSGSFSYRTPSSPGYGTYDDYLTDIYMNPGSQYQTYDQWKQNLDMSMPG